MRYMVIALLALVVGCSSGNRKDEAKKAESTVQKINVSVSGMVCTSCEKSISTKVAKLDGVKSVVASQKDGTASVEFDNSKVNEKDVIAAIESLGYKAHIQTETPTAKQ